MPMSDYRRVYIPGGCYFLTMVTYRRQLVFADELNVARLRQASKTVKAKSCRPDRKSVV